MPADRSKLPSLGPDPGIHLPRIAKHRDAETALRLWTVEHRELPVISFVLLLPVGIAADPPDRPGLAAFTADMLDEGSGTSDSFAIHERLARIGGVFDTEVGADATMVSLTTLAKFARPALELLAEIMMAPRFDPEDVRRVRALRLSRLMQLRDVPSALAERMFAARLYGSHPYGHTAMGTEASLNAITVGELRTFHEESYRRSRPVLVAAGDVSHQELVDLVGATWGTSSGNHWQWGGADGVPLAARGETPAVVLPPRTPGAPRIAIVDRPGAAQSELRIGRVAAARSTPDFHTLGVLNTALGGAFVSRINLKLREEKGYTYGARSSFEFRRQTGPFAVQASVQTDATAESVEDVLREIAEIGGERPITADELSRAQAALVRGFPRGFETAEQISRAMCQLALYDLPDDYFDLFVPRVKAVTADAVTAAAARYLPSRDMEVVVVGDRERVMPSLLRLGLGEPVDLSASQDIALASASTT
jgi:zinc protease